MRHIMQDLKTFRLDELEGKTLKILKFTDPGDTKDNYCIVTVGVDINTKCLYVLEIVTGLKRGTK